MRISVFPFSRFFFFLTRSKKLHKNTWRRKPIADDDRIAFSGSLNTLGLTLHGLQENCFQHGLTRYKQMGNNKWKRKKIRIN